MRRKKRPQAIRYPPPLLPPFPVGSFHDNPRLPPLLDKEQQKRQKCPTIPGHAVGQEILNHLGSDLLIGKRRKEASPVRCKKVANKT